MTRAPHLAPTIALCLALALSACGGGDAGSSATVGPTVTGFLPAAVPSEVPTDYTVTGTGFGPVGSTVRVRFEASSATPFAGGGASAVEMDAEIVSPTEIQGTTCPCGLQDAGGDVPCAVTVVLPGDEDAVGAPDVGAVVTRPTLTAVSPPALPGPGTTFVVEGTGFGPEAQVWMVEFTAVARTPFAGGTSATLLVPASVVSPTMLMGTLPPTAAVLMPVAASVVAVCPSGARVASDGPIVTFDP